MAKLREAASDVSNAVSDVNQANKFLEVISEEMLEIPFDTLQEQLGEAAWDVAVDMGLVSYLAEFGGEALCLLL